MRPRLTWANVLIFVLGAALIVGGFRNSIFYECALGSLLAASGVGMAYNQRWAFWPALAGLITAEALVAYQLYRVGFSWRMSLGAVGVAILIWDIGREMHAAKRERDKPLISLVQFRRVPNNFLTDKKLSEIAQRLWGDQ